MKFLFLLYFAFTTPFIILILTLEYGGLTTNIIKQNLATSSLYSEVNKLVTQSLPENADENQTQVTEIINAKFTSAYIQSKTEKAIDDSALWITGKSTESPVISFKDLKEDIILKNPELLTTLQTYAQQANDNSTTDQTDQPAPPPTLEISRLVNSDFSIKLGTYLQSFKLFYSVMHIILILDSLLVIGSLIGITKLASSKNAAFKWIASAFLTTGVIGYGAIMMNSFIIFLLTNFLDGNANHIIAIISPFIKAIGNQISNRYIYNQGIVSICFLLLAAVCYTIASFTKPKGVTITTTKPNKKLKK